MSHTPHKTDSRITYVNESYTTYEGVMKNVPQAHLSCSSCVCTFACVYVWMSSILLYVFEIPPQTVYCWVLPCLALQCDTVKCSALQRISVWYSVMQRVTVCCSVIQCDSVWSFTHICGNLENLNSRNKNSTLKSGHQNESCPGYKCISCVPISCHTHKYVMPQI